MYPPPKKRKKTMSIGNETAWEVFRLRADGTPHLLHCVECDRTAAAIDAMETAAAIDAVVCLKIKAASDFDCYAGIEGTYYPDGSRLRAECVIPEVFDAGTNQWKMAT